MKGVSFHSTTRGEIPSDARNHRFAKREQKGTRTESKAIRWHGGQIGIGERACRLERCWIHAKSPRRESTVREPHSGVPGESRAIWKLHHCLEIALCFNSRYNPLRIIAARIFPQIRNRNQNPPTDSPGWQTPGRNEIVDSAFAD